MEEQNKNYIYKPRSILQIITIYFITGGIIYGLLFYFISALSAYSLEAKAQSNLNQTMELHQKQALIFPY
jgi:hypothetical protein